MICALCNEREANKKNTHYLTDGIIRSCLNLDGSSQREKGFYFDLSTNSPFMEFSFQRETDIEKVEESLGRNPNSKEIDEAKKLPFSVDFLFCNVCEDHFTSIENDFFKSILPQLRNSDLEKIYEFNFPEIKIIRLFFYLQLWRSHICQETLKLPDETAQEIRYLLLNSKNVNISEISVFPMAINYLETLGGSKEYTANFVGFTNDKNPYIIFFNDFIIQFYDSVESIQFFDLYNLNSNEDFPNYINFKEDIFRIIITHDSERKKFLGNFLLAEKVKMSVHHYTNSFNRLWRIVFREDPTPQIIQEYLNTITGNGKFEILQYSRERIVEITYRFILSKF